MIFAIAFAGLSPFGHTCSGHTNERHSVVSTSDDIPQRTLGNMGLLLRTTLTRTQFMIWWHRYSENSSSSARNRSFFFVSRESAIHRYACRVERAAPASAALTAKFDNMQDHARARKLQQQTE